MVIAAFLHRQANSLSQHKMTPLVVHIALPRALVEERQRLDECFGCSVNVDDPGTDFIRFSYADAMGSYAGANAMLREANEQAVMQYLNHVRQFYFTVRMAEEIRDMVKAGEGVEIGAIALRLRLSSRTQQRRLEGEGTTFAELLEKHRRQLAHDALAHGEMSITEIACMAGFSASSNFSCSCCRWFGASPAASCRRRIRQLPP